MPSDTSSIAASPLEGDAGLRGLAARLRHRLDTRTKPLGSLGALETIALRIGLVLGSGTPRFTQPTVVVFAADHGVCAESVSAYPSEVTSQMVENYLRGGAAINVLVRQHGLRLRVIDAGVARELAPSAGLKNLAVARGTRNFRHEAAMTGAQCEQAIRTGRAVAAAAVAEGSNALLLGEMGIGNTASAALLLHRLTGWPLERCVGRGAGLDDVGVDRKRSVLEAASARRKDELGPSELLAEFGGFEIAMLAGAFLEIARCRCIAVIDGFTVSVAALLASRLDDQVLTHCVFSHCSAENAHRALLKYLDVEPVLDLQMRLGEASGAAAAWPLIESAVRLMNEMASFESAGVSSRQVT